MAEFSFAEKYKVKPTQNFSFAEKYKTKPQQDFSFAEQYKVKPSLIKEQQTTQIAQPSFRQAEESSMKKMALQKAAYAEPIYNPFGEEISKEFPKDVQESAKAGGEMIRGAIVEPFAESFGYLYTGLAGKQEDREAVFENNKKIFDETAPNYIDKIKEFPLNSREQLLEIKKFEQDLVKKGHTPLDAVQSIQSVLGTVFGDTEKALRMIREGTKYKNLPEDLKASVHPLWLVLDSLDIGILADFGVKLTSNIIKKLPKVFTKKELTSLPDLPDEIKLDIEDLDKSPKQIEAQTTPEEIVSETKNDQQIIIDNELKEVEQELKDLRTRHEQEKIETFGEDWLTKSPKELTQQQRNIYESFYARQSKELDEVVQRVKAARKKAEDFKKQPKQQIFDETTRQQKNIPNYIDDAIELASQYKIKSNFNPGPNYQRAIYDLTPVKEKKQKKILNRQEILGQFIKDLDISIREGGIRSKKTMGFFRPYYEQTVIKKKADIDTAAHEIAHFLDKRISSIRQKYQNDPVVKKELKDVSYDQDSVEEGFAEFFRIYIGDSARAKKLAPNFYDWFDNNLRADNFKTKIYNKERSVQKAVLNAQNNFSSFYRQTPEEKLRSKIGNYKAINNARMSFLDDMYSDLIDGIYGIAKYERQLGKDDLDIYFRASALRYGDSIMEKVEKFGAPKIVVENGKKLVRFDTTTKGFHQILKPVADLLDEYFFYAVARRAKVLKYLNKERLLTNAEIEAGLALGEKYPIFKKVHVEHQQLNKSIFQFGVDYGEIFTKDFMDKLSFNEYIPFYRVNSGKPGGRGKGIKSFTGLKKLVGGEDNLLPIYENIVNNWTMIIRESIANRIKLDILIDAKKYNAFGPGRFISPIPTPKAIKYDLALSQDIKNQILDSLFGNQTMAKLLDGYGEFKELLEIALKEIGDFTKVMTVGKRPQYEQLMPVLQNGIIKYYEVYDPLLYRALEAVGSKDVGLIPKQVLQYFGLPKRIIQSSITLAFDFIGGNFFRDNLSAAIFNKFGFIPFYDSARGLISRWTKDQNYRDFSANGGTLSGFYANEKLFLKKISPFYSKKGINVKKVVTSPAKLIELFEEMSSAVEEATRIGGYIRGIESGATKYESVYQALESSINFKKRGTYKTIPGAFFALMSEIILFLRPTVLGVDKLARGLFKESNRLKSAGRLAMATGFVGALALVNRYNPLYEELEDWDKDTNIHIFFPTKEGWDFVFKNGRLPYNNRDEATGYNIQTGEFTKMFNHWRIPKPHDFGAIMSTAERGLLNFFDSLSKSSKEQFLDIWLRQFKADLIPAIMKPLIEIKANKSFFTDRPIDNLSEIRLIAPMRGYGKASQTAQELGKKLNMSPNQIEHFMKGYFNYFAGYGFTLSDQMFFSGNPDLSTDQYPLFGRFIRETKGARSKYVNEAYSLMNEFNQVYASAIESGMRMDIDYLANIFNHYSDPTGLTAEEYADNLALLKDYSNDQRGKLAILNNYTGEIRETDSIERLKQIAVEIEKRTRREGYVQSLSQKGLFQDIGALKKYMIDDVVYLKTSLAKEYVKIIESLNSEGK